MERLIQRITVQRPNRPRQPSIIHLTTLVQRLSFDSANRTPTFRVDQGFGVTELPPRDAVQLWLKVRDVLECNLRVEYVWRRAGVDWLGKRRDLGVKNDALIFRDGLLILGKREEGVVSKSGLPVS